MSWRRESAALARELAGLAVDGSSAWLTGGQLNQAVAVRRDLLLLLGRVVSDVRSAPARGGTGWPIVLRRPSRPRGELTAYQLETDPVQALEQALRAHPAPRGRHGSAGHVGDGVPAGEAGWAAVGRRTELAARAWWDVDPAVLTTGERWSTVADVAALAQAVTVLDRDLLAAAELPNRDVPVFELRDAVTSGLRLAAREAAGVAAAGPLPDWDQPGDRPALELVMVVRSARDLPHAQDRLAAQLEAGGTLSPQSVVLIATGQARLLAAAAAALNDSPGPTEHASWAADLSRRVADSVAGAQLLASAGGSRPPARAVEQSREMATYATGGPMMTGPGLDTEDRAALVAAVSRAPRVLGALARQADRAWRAGAWLVPDPRSEGLSWIPAGRMDREPRLCSQLSAVAAYSVARPGGAVSPGAARTGPTPPRELLADVGRARRPGRPPLPSQRPDARPGRG